MPTWRQLVESSHRDIHAGVESSPRRSFPPERPAARAILEVAEGRSAEKQGSDQRYETPNNDNRDTRGVESSLLTGPTMQHQSNSEHEHRLAARVLCKLASYGRKDSQGEGESETELPPELDFVRRTSSVNTSMPRLNVSRLEEWLQELQPALPHQLPFGAGPAPPSHGDVALAASPAATGVSHARSRAIVDAPAEGKTAPVHASSVPWSASGAQKAAKVLELEHGKRTEQAGASAHADQALASPGGGVQVGAGEGAGAGAESPPEGQSAAGAGGAEASSGGGMHGSQPGSRVSGQALTAEAEAGLAPQGSPRHKHPGPKEAVAATAATVKPLGAHTQPAMRMDEAEHLEQQQQQHHYQQQQQPAAGLSGSADTDAVSGAGGSPRQAADPMGEAAPTAARSAALPIPTVPAAHPAAGAPPAAAPGASSQLEQLPDDGSAPAPADTCGPAALRTTAAAAAAVCAADNASPTAPNSEPTGTATANAANDNAAAGGAGAAAGGVSFGFAEAPPLSAVVSYGAQLARRLVQVQRLKSRLGELEELLCDRLAHVRCHVAAAQGGAHARAAERGQQQPFLHADQSAVANMGSHPGDHGAPCPAFQGLDAVEQRQPGGAALEREQALGEQHAAGSRSRAPGSVASDAQDAKTQGGDGGGGGGGGGREGEPQGDDEGDPLVGHTSRRPQPPRTLLLPRSQQPGAGAGPSASPQPSSRKQAETARTAAGTAAAPGGAAGHRKEAAGGPLGPQHGAELRCADEAVAVEVLGALSRMSPGPQAMEQQQQGLRPEADEGQHGEEQQGRLRKRARAAVGPEARGEVPGGAEGLGPDQRGEEPSGGPAAAQRAGAAPGERMELSSPGSPAGAPVAAASATPPALGQQPLTAAAAATPDGSARDELRALGASPAAGSSTATSPAATAAAAAAVAAAAVTAAAAAAGSRGLQLQLLQQSLQQQLLRQQASPASTTPTSAAVLAQAQARAQGLAEPRGARAMAEALLRSAAGAAAGCGAQVASDVAGRRAGDGRTVTTATWDIAHTGGPQGTQPVLQHVKRQEQQRPQQQQQQQQLLLNLQLREVLQLQQQQHAQPRQQHHHQQQQDCGPVPSPPRSATSGLPNADQHTARQTAGPAAAAAATAGAHAASARGALDGGRGARPPSPPLKRQRTSEAGAPGGAQLLAGRTSLAWPNTAPHASGEAGRRRSSAPEVPWAGGGGQWPSAPSQQPQPLPGRDQLQPLPLPLPLQRLPSGQLLPQHGPGPEVALPRQASSTSPPGSRHGLGSQGSGASAAPGPGVLAGAPGRVQAMTPGSQLLRLPAAVHRHRGSSDGGGGGGGGGGQASGGEVLQVVVDARGHVVDVVGAHPAALLQRGAGVLQLLLPRGGSGPGRGPDAAAEHPAGLRAAAEEAQAAMRRRSSSYTGGGGLMAGEHGDAGGRLERAPGLGLLQQGPGPGSWHRQQAGGVLARSLSSSGTELATAMAPPLVLGLRQVQDERMAGQWGPGAQDGREGVGAAGQREYGQGARAAQLLELQRQGWGLAGPGPHRGEGWQQGQRQGQQAGPGGRAELLGLSQDELQGPARQLSGSGVHLGLQGAAGRGRQQQQQQHVRGPAAADRQGASLAEGGGVELRAAGPGGREAQGRPWSRTQPHTQRPPALGQLEQQGPVRQGQGQGQGQGHR